MLAVVFWSRFSAGCRLWRLVLLSVEGLSINSCPACRHLCRVIYSSPGPSPCHWLMSPSLLALCTSRLSSLVEGYFSQTGTHGPWDAHCSTTPPPPPPRLVFFIFFPFKSPRLHFGKGKIWSIHWNAEITLMKDVLLNVSKMAKIWIGELITFKWMHLSEAFIQSDSNIAFRVYSLSLCVLPEIKHMTLVLPVLCFTIWVPCLPFLPYNNGTSMGTGEKCYIWFYYVFQYIKLYYYIYILLIIRFLVLKPRH